MVIHIIDSVPGRKTGGYDWDTPLPKLTLREIIAERVRREVDQYNQNRPIASTGLLPRTEAESILNGERPLRPSLDPDHEIDRVCCAFEHNAFVVFARGEQLESLDTKIDLTTACELEFIRLLPLAGG